MSSHSQRRARPARDPVLIAGRLAGRTATLTVQIPRDQLPYDLLVPVPQKQPDAEITVVTTTGAQLKAKLAGAALRRKLIEAGRDHTSVVFLSGQLAPDNRLIDAGLTVVVRAPADSQHT